MEVASPDNTEMTEAEFREARSVPADPVAQPPDFTEVSPTYVSVKFRREALAGVLGWLRGQKVKVDFRSIRPTCDELRSGEQVVNLQIDPERSAAFVQASRAAPGVLAAGWISADDYRIENAVRFAADGWRDARGTLMKEKLAAAVADLVAEALAARSHASAWDDVTGELALTLKRPSRLVPGMNLTETVESRFLVSAEKPGGRDRLILWVADPHIDTSDEGTNPLSLGWSSDKDDEEHDVSPETADIVAAAAEKLKGQRWDSEESKWQ
jgi:hypothetical protein